MNGSARKIYRCVLSVVVDISSVENSCEPTYRTIRITSVLPVAFDVRSSMNRKADSGDAPHGCGLFDVPG